VTVTAPTPVTTPSCAGVSVTPLFGGSANATVTSGQNSTLSWSSSGADGMRAVCTGSAANVTPSGEQAAGISNTGFAVGPINAASSCTFTPYKNGTACTAVTASVTPTAAPAPACAGVSFERSPSFTALAGFDENGGQATIDWKIIGADSATLSCTGNLSNLGQSSALEGNWNATISSWDGNNQVKCTFTPVKNGTNCAAQTAVVNKPTNDCRKSDGQLIAVTGVNFTTPTLTTGSNYSTTLNHSSNANGMVLVCTGGNTFNGGVTVNQGTELTLAGHSTTTNCTLNAYNATGKVCASATANVMTGTAPSSGACNVNMEIGDSQQNGTVVARNGESGVVGTHSTLFVYYNSNANRVSYSCSRTSGAANMVPPGGTAASGYFQVQPDYVTGSTTTCTVTGYNSANAVCGTASASTTVPSMCSMNATWNAESQSQAAASNYANGKFVSGDTLYVSSLMVNNPNLFTNFNWNLNGGFTYNSSNPSSFPAEINCTGAFVDMTIINPDINGFTYSSGATQYSGLPQNSGSGLLYSFAQPAGSCTITGNASSTNLSCSTTLSARHGTLACGDSVGACRLHLAPFQGEYIELTNGSNATIGSWSCLFGSEIESCQIIN
jgi:hypothetical protein